MTIYLMYRSVHSTSWSRSAVMNSINSLQSLFHSILSPPLVILHPHSPADSLVLEGQTAARSTSRISGWETLPTEMDEEKETYVG